MDGFSSALVLSLVMISSTTTVYLSGVKVVALRYPFYVMSRRVKRVLKGSLALIALAILCFEICGVVVSGDCFHDSKNIFPLFVIAVNTTSWEFACFSKGIQNRALEEIRKGKINKARAWDEQTFKPHLAVFLVTAVLGLILSGLVIWEILKIKSAMVQEQSSQRKSGVVTTLLINLGNALNAVFCTLDLFLSLDARAHAISSVMTLIFFPMLLCCFSPLVIILRGSKVKEDMKGSFAVAVRKTASVMRRIKI